MNITSKIVSLSVLILIASCEQEKNDTWEAFIYPDKNNLLEHKNIGVYSSLESCRVAALNKLSTISTVENGDYECGLNCTTKNEFKVIKTCEQTHR